MADFAPSLKSGDIGSGGSNGSPQGASRVFRFPWWLRVIPFVMSAALFTSAIFSVFAPMPILFLVLSSRLRMGYIAFVTNALIVLLSSGLPSLLIYSIYVFPIAVALPTFLNWVEQKVSRLDRAERFVVARKNRYVEKAVGLSFVVMMALAGLALAAYSVKTQQTPWVQAQAYFSEVIDQVLASVSPEAKRNMLSGLKVSEFKERVLFELPSFLIVSVIVMVWMNLAILLRVNPGRIRERLGLSAAFLREWKAPEALLWPTIATGFFLVYDAGTISLIALNLFKVLMVFYAIQGLSVLASLFDAWKLRGGLRMGFYVLVVFLMLPLLLSLGFFDLWFDFRAKLKQQES